MLKHMAHHHTTVQPCERAKVFFYVEIAGVIVLALLCYWFWGGANG